MSWKWAASSRRGTSHVRAGTRCDDSSRVVLVGPGRDILVAVASDGAGSAAFGAAGAVLVCRTFVDSARRHFAGGGSLPGHDDAADWLDAARDRIAIAAESRAASLRDFAATLVAAIVSPTAMVTAHVGDGAIVARSAGGWRAASWPETGEYASTTFFVTDEPAPRLRWSEVAEPVDAVAVFTDGIERLVLDLSQGTPHSPFFERMIAPVAAAEALGRSASLSAALGRYLDSDAVNERTDDDKTLILAVRP